MYSLPPLMNSDLEICLLTKIYLLPQNRYSPLSQSFIDLCRAAKNLSHSRHIFPAEVKPATLCLLILAQVPSRHMSFLPSIECHNLTFLCFLLMHLFLHIGPRHNGELVFPISKHGQAVMCLIERSFSVREASFRLEFKNSKPWVQC